MNFYNFFLSLCSQAGVKPSPAGEAVGVSRTAVNGWKNGRLPTDSTLQALSDYFDVPFSEFLKCEDIAKKRGIKLPASPDQEQQTNFPQREQMEDELRILFNAAEDAPPSAILEAAALLMRYKEQNNV